MSGGAPEGRPESNSRRRAIGAARLALLLLIGIPAAWVALLARPPGPPGAPPRSVEIPAGATTSQIAQILVQEGVIRHGPLFVAAARLMGLDARLQAGEYRLSPDLGLMQVLRHLEEGRIATELVTIPEGFAIAQIAQLLEARGIVEAERFVELAQDDTLVYGENPPIEKSIRSLEGYLFPDTYRFAPGAPPETVIRRMVGRFVEKALPVIQAAGDEAGASLDVHEVVTLASIVEKEAAVAEERPVIAAVFLNRLRSNMPLQADPTVKYAMDDPPVRLLYAHLNIDSPYNTYRYRGLPPGPIASPGLSSIEAVLQPADVDYLFFVAAGDGTHRFTRTYDEHLRIQRTLTAPSAPIRQP